MRIKNQIVIQENCYNHINNCYPSMKSPHHSHDFPAKELLSLCLTKVWSKLEFLIYMWLRVKQVAYYEKAFSNQSVVCWCFSVHCSFCYIDVLYWSWMNDAHFSNCFHIYRLMALRDIINYSQHATLQSTLSVDMPNTKGRP